MRGEVSTKRAVLVRVFYTLLALSSTAAFLIALVDLLVASKRASFNNASQTEAVWLRAGAQPASYVTPVLDHRLVSAVYFDPVAESVSVDPGFEELFFPLRRPIQLRLRDSSAHVVARLASGTFLDLPALRSFGLLANGLLWPFVVIMLVTGVLVWVFCNDWCRCGLPSRR